MPQWSKRRVCENDSKDAPAIHGGSGPMALPLGRDAGCDRPRTMTGTARGLFRPAVDLRVTAAPRRYKTVRNGPEGAGESASFSPGRLTQSRCATPMREAALAQT